ncbi:MAG: glutamate 5-kinase [Opitutales bacterium]|nr:glutamate 5-kinase [Opitutales bacterium]
MKRITVKIGSNVLTREDGTLDVTRMSALVDQIVCLNRRGLEIIVISSGAVASGRSELKIPTDSLDAVSARQLFSAVGQAKLMNHYFDFFRNNNSACGQVLTTKEEFTIRSHYRNIKRCMDIMLENKVVPIVNENDTISVTELMFTDNDELSGLISEMMNSDMLIILSNVDGIFTDNPSNEGAELIREIEADREDFSMCVTTKKSKFGRGGMITKCNIARRIASEGIPVIIANGKRENILVDLIDHPETTRSTRFLTPPKTARENRTYTKRTVAVDSQIVGELSKIGAPRDINSKDIIHYTGEFFRDELISVLDGNGKAIGVGKAACSSAELASLLENPNSAPQTVIRSDFLFLE